MELHILANHKARSNQDDINLSRVRLGLPPIPMFMEPMFLEGMQRAGHIRRYDSNVTPGPVKFTLTIECLRDGTHEY